MAEYYLISQLPSLDGISENAPLPITEERFLELCQSFLSKKTYKELERLSLIPDKDYQKSSSALIEKWNDGERNLRIALAKIRADKMKKAFEFENINLPSSLLQVARTATESDSPLEAEKLLNKHRLDFLESLRPSDTFSDEYIFYYWLELKLLVRTRQFDTDKGEAAYRNIYNSIMNGDKAEVVQ